MVSAAAADSDWAGHTLAESAGLWSPASACWSSWSRDVGEKALCSIVAAWDG